MPQIRSIADLFARGLAEMLNAEATFVRATQASLTGLHDPVLRERLQTHMTDTQGQISRLQVVYESVGWDGGTATCAGARGLAADVFGCLSDTAPPALERHLCGLLLRVEHFEVAAYASLTEQAEHLGLSREAALLAENLEQEQAMADVLEERVGRLFALDGPEANTEVNAETSAEIRPEPSRQPVQPGLTRHAPVQHGVSVMEKHRA